MLGNKQIKHTKRFSMKNEDKVWLAIIGISIMFLCFFIGWKNQEEPKRDTGVILVDYESQKD